MTVITHSLFPVVARQMTELVRREPVPYRAQLRGWLVIAGFGLLPDALSPHITLGARCNAFSHQWVATAVVVAGCWLYAFWARHRPAGAVAVWCGVAYVLHVAGDIASGGLDFLGTGHAIGEYWISPGYWPIVDLACILAFVLLHRRVRAGHGLDPSVIRVLRRWLGR